MKSFLLAIAIGWGGFVYAQPELGYWQGVLYQAGGITTKYFPQIIHFTEIKFDNQYTGKGLSVVPNTAFYARYDAPGSFIKRQNVFRYSTNIFEKKNDNTFYWCSGAVSAIYDEAEQSIKGKWSTFSCPPGTVELYHLQILSKTTFCAGDDIQLKASGKNIRWYRDSTRQQPIGSGNEISISMTESLVLWVTQTVYDTETPPAAVPVTIRQKNQAVIEKSICAGSSFMMFTEAGTYSYETTSPSQCPTVTTLKLAVVQPRDTMIRRNVCFGEAVNGHKVTGTYRDTFRNVIGCDSLRTTLHLTVRPLLQNQETIKICKGAEYRSHNVAGRYIDTLKSVNGCDSFVTVDLQVLDKPQPYFKQETELCAGKTLVLSPVGEFSTYRWQDGSRDKTLTVQNPGIYTVEVANSCGFAKAAITVTGIVCDIYVPNAFTPNGDGKNDRLKVANITQDVTGFQFTVFNRLGQKVFTTANPLIGWDGSVKGQLSPNAAFVWQLTYTKSGKHIERKGTVTLIR